MGGWDFFPLDTSNSQHFLMIKQQGLILFPAGECCDLKMWEAGKRKFNENHMLSGFASLMFMNIMVHKDSFTSFSY